MGDQEGGECVSIYLKAFNSQAQHAGRQLRGLLEGEVTPVYDQNKSVYLKLRIFNHGFQRQQDGT